MMSGILDMFSALLYSDRLSTPVTGSIFTILVASIILYMIVRNKEKKRLVGYVSGLRTHPVKSCKPILLHEAEVTSLGLKHDRQFVLVNEYGTFMSLRKFPKFVLIKQTVTDDSIVLEAEGMPPLVLPLQMKQEDGDHCTDVTVWRKTTFGVHVSHEADDWFASYLNVEGCKLYCYPVDGKPRYAEDWGVKIKKYTNEKDTLMFGDGCPLLIVSNPSVYTLNKMITEKVTVDHFRPNIIISKCSPFAEERWGLIEINGVRLQSLYPCGRCVAVNVDPYTGSVNKNIMQEVLRVKPSSESDYPRIEGKPLFGMNYGVRKEGFIKIGDPVYEIET